MNLTVNGKHVEVSVTPLDKAGIDGTFLVIVAIIAAIVVLLVLVVPVVVCACGKGENESVDANPPWESVPMRQQELPNNAENLKLVLVYQNDGINDDEV